MLAPSGGSCIAMRNLQPLRKFSENRKAARPLQYGKCCSRLLADDSCTHMLQVQKSRCLHLGIQWAIRQARHGCSHEQELSCLFQSGGMTFICSHIGPFNSSLSSFMPVTLKLVVTAAIFGLQLCSASQVKLSWLHMLAEQLGTASDDFARSAVQQCRLYQALAAKESCRKLPPDKRVFLLVIARTMRTGIISMLTTHQPESFGNLLPPVAGTSSIAVQCS